MVLKLFLMFRSGNHIETPCRGLETNVSLWGILGQKVSWKKHGRFWITAWLKESSFSRSLFSRPPYLCFNVVHFCIYPATTASPSFWVNGQPQNNSRNKCGQAKVSPQTILDQQQFFFINMSCLCTLPNHQLLLVHNYLWIFHCNGSLQCMHVHVYAILL